jgi:alginate O-acetyltransferase complex protein AlgI
MVFNSITFLIFFISFFIIYWTIAKRARLKITNLFILLCSYLFYGWWDWRFLGLILFSSVIDYLVALQLEKTSDQKKRKALLCISIFTNIGLLSFFKYYNFFVDSLIALFESFAIPFNVATLSIVLPVGISFYTFQALSYTIDVYRKRLKACNDPVAFLTFVAFFPQLVAGPIERAKELLPQFYEKKKFSYPAVIAGLRLMLWGFFQKIVIADNLAPLVEKVYGAPENYSGLCILMATFGFAFQIYCDFAGYSNIAIGAAKTLGFYLSPNFSTPYFSSSFTDFWRRWHISLSSWFKDYVYIPLGGNRKNKFRTNINLLLTFTLSGLWHGAASTFILWGFLHGLLLITSKSIRLKVNKIVSTVFIFLCVAILWLPFRAKSLNNFQLLLERIFNYPLEGAGATTAFLQTFSLLKWECIAIAFIGFIAMEAKMNTSDFDHTITAYKRPVRISLYYVLLVAILLLGNFSMKPYFIYFQF